jgi:hypothetical protein
MLTDQLERGDDCHGIRRVISIVIVDFNLIEDSYTKRSSRVISA